MYTEHGSGAGNDIIKMVAPAGLRAQLAEHKQQMTVDRLPLLLMTLKQQRG
jgi:hypothetical protein